MLTFKNMYFSVFLDELLKYFVVCFVHLSFSYKNINMHYDNHNCYGQMFLKRLETQDSIQTDYTLHFTSYISVMLQNFLQHRLLQHHMMHDKIECGD